MQKRHIVVGAGLALVAAALVAWFALISRPPAALQGRIWQLDEIQTLAGATIFTSPQPDGFTLRFEGTKLIGNAVCNTFSGPYRINRLTRTIAPISNQIPKTVRGCNLPFVAWETPFFHAVVSANRYELAGPATLKLYVDAEDQVLVFRGAVR